jgi:hypothetical protein
MKVKFYASKAVCALVLTIFLHNCSKLDTTQQGADVLEVDNINTFETYLDVETYQGIFGSYPGAALNNPLDTTLLRKNENHALGWINEPNFAETKSSISLQLKPVFYPYYFGGAGDTIRNGIPGPTTGPVSINAGLDSVFLCLSYRGSLGDTSLGNIPQTFEVREINDVDGDFFAKPDSVYQANGVIDVKPTILGSASITNQQIQNYFVFRKGSGLKDSVRNQIRIKLDISGANNIIRQIYNADTTSTATNNWLRDDSVFRKKFAGFQITASGSASNTMYYVNLADVNTNLEFHFRKTKLGSGAIDTLVDYFYFYAQPVGESKVSASINNIARTYKPAITSAAASTVNQPFVSIGATPGTYARLKIPGLSTLSNRVVHRAYIIAEQDDAGAPTNPFLALQVPRYLYIDLKQPTASTPQQFKPLYFDLSNQAYNPDIETAFFPTGGVNFNVFNAGAFLQNNASGNYNKYEINITRYVQNILSKGLFNHEIRMFAPYSIQYSQYRFYGREGSIVFPYSNELVGGSVRLAGGGNPANNKKMRLRIIYSNL